MSGNEMCYLEMTNPNSEEWKALKPPRKRLDCENFYALSCAQAVLAGCKFRIRSQEEVDKELEKP